MQKTRPLPDGADVAVGREASREGWGTGVNSTLRELPDLPRELEMRSPWGSLEGKREESGSTAHRGQH